MSRNAATLLVTLTLLIPLGVGFWLSYRHKRFQPFRSDGDRLLSWTGLAALNGILLAFVVGLFQRPGGLGLLAISLWGGVFVALPMAGFQAFGIGAEWLVRRLRGPAWLEAVAVFVSAFPGTYVGMTASLTAMWVIGGLAGGFGAFRLFDNWHGGNHSLALTMALFGGALRMASDLRARAAERQVERMKAEMTTAHLRHLENRLRPHFLYNALSGLAGLIREHPDRAEAMTLALARLLQRSLDGDDTPTLPLRAELELVRAYLDVEQQRFGDRLEVHVHVEPGLLDAEVPRLTLQPLVENTIKHGLAHTDGPFRIDVAATRSGQHLHLTVSDDGPPFPDDLTGGNGLTSITERLRLLYGDAFSMHFVNSEEPGRRKHVRLTLPYRDASPIT